MRLPIKIELLIAAKFCSNSKLDTCIAISIFTPCSYEAGEQRPGFISSFHKQNMKRFVMLLVTLAVANSFSLENGENAALKTKVLGPSVLDAGDRRILPKILTTETRFARQSSEDSNVGRSSMDASVSGGQKNSQQDWGINGKRGWGINGKRGWGITGGYNGRNWGVSGSYGSNNGKSSLGISGGLGNNGPPGWHVGFGYHKKFDPQVNYLSGSQGRRQNGPRYNIRTK
ncbi:uncharacterized protein [Pocillopora verrucosa]|uniref:uncharacterized protein isoform X2 n=1 Tax=Pocillopora verrucosa TaxID=203993 RepID=UPI00333E88EB